MGGTPGAATPGGAPPPGDSAAGSRGPGAGGKTPPAGEASEGAGSMHWTESLSSSSSSSSTAGSDPLAGAEALADVKEGPAGPGRVHEGGEVKVKGGKRGHRPKALDPPRRRGLARPTAAASTAREPLPLAMRPRPADSAGRRGTMSLPTVGTGAAGGGAGATTSGAGGAPAVLVGGGASRRWRVRWGRGRAPRQTR
jgi:hypothetical protein